MAKLCGAVAPVACLLLAFVALQIAFLFLEVNVREVFHAAGLDLNWNLAGAGGRGSGELNCSTGGVGGGGDSNASSLLLQPAGVGLYPVVLFSAHRENGSTLHVLGLVSRLIAQYGKPVFECSWHPGNGSNPLVTTPQLHDGRSGFAHLPYNEMVFTCQFEQEVGTDGQGGCLYLAVKLSVMAMEIGGGQQIPPILALCESAGYNFTEIVARPHPYKYAFCSAPISGTVRPDRLKEWLIYHFYLFEGPRAHFFLYDTGPVTEEVRAVLDPFVKAGFVTIWDVLDGVLYPAWWRSQILCMNDCLHRLRHLTDWVLFMDFDEFMYVAPPNTFSGLMEANAEAPVVTYGSWPVDIKVCRSEEKDGEWPLERMLWRQRTPECRDKREKQPYLCLGPVARRKYAVNPRKEIIVAVHSPLGDSYNHAYHMNASVMRLEHYRGILTQHSCIKHRNRSSPLDGSGNVVEMEPVIIPLIPQAMKFAASFNLIL